MYIGSINNLKPTFRSLYNQAEIILQSGGTVDIELAKHKQKRTNEQNAYYWLFNGQLAEFLNNAGLTYGEFQIPYTADIIHNIQKKLYGVKTTTKLSIGDFCEYMNKLLLFWQERTGGEFAMSELPANYLERKGYVIQ